MAGGSPSGGDGVSVARGSGQRWQVIVIGTGQAGLATAHELRRRGLLPGRDVLVLDAGEGPGGAWRDRWDSLTLGRAHAIADLPGMPLGEASPDLPASRVVADYYGRYEERFDLGVLRPARVTRVTSTGLAAPALATDHRGGHALVDRGVPRDTWLSVEAEVGGVPRTFLTRMVLSATGTWTHPYVPWVPGAPTFEGRQLHTVDYRRAEEFAGQRVLVVGGGLSAVQFLLELEGVAPTVWATRRPPNFTDATFDAVWGVAVEEAVDARTAAGLPPASVVRTTGIPRIPDYLRGIRRGVLVSRGMFDRIGPHGVRFSPAATSGDAAGLGPSAAGAAGLVEPDSWRPYARETWVDVDVIFWNTGFRHATTHLRPLRLREAGTGGIVMDGRVSVAADPRVLLVGYGSSASTVGATRAGREAGRLAAHRLANHAPSLP